MSTTVGTTPRRATVAGATALTTAVLPVFLVGALGATMIHGPSMAHTLLVDMEALGILLGRFSPFVFGILLPLTE